MRLLLAIGFVANAVTWMPCFRIPYLYERYKDEEVRDSIMAELRAVCCGDWSEVRAGQDWSAVSPEELHLMCGFSLGTMTHRECCSSGWALVDPTPITPRPEFSLPPELRAGPDPGLWSPDYVSLQLRVRTFF